jgi:Fe-S-cluster-containing hydrogenase component 2
MLINDGIPTKDDLTKITPTDERFAKGPVAILECFQEIPCNPCVKACKRGAITMPRDINDLPIIDVGLCNGCGICISYCPGLAIFVVDKTYSKDLALVKLPFEYVPVPMAGLYVTVLDRAGKELGSFEVIKVISGGEKNKTYTVSIAVPQELAMEARGIRESVSKLTRKTKGIRDD